ncbi:MAG TPA: hypothetical protein VKR32_11740 [Puia sp.]|nr:hypothetical protein [Puia sp.]
MRKLAIILMLPSILACTKASLTNRITGAWNLYSKNPLGNSSDVQIFPAADSPVQLMLLPNHMYISTLAGTIISKGIYTLSADSFLALNDFTQTGIFQQFVLAELTPSRTIITAGMYVQITDDTMVLSSLATPDGTLKYTFYKIGGF